MKKYRPSLLAVGPEFGFGIGHMSAKGYLQNVSWAEKILQGTELCEFSFVSITHRKHSQRRESDLKHKPHTQIVYSLFLSILRCVNITFF